MKASISFFADALSGVAAPDVTRTTSAQTSLGSSAAH